MHFEWVRNYPITGRAAAIDSSGYVYFVGRQTDATQKILKYDSLGNIIWAKDFNVITGSNYLGIAAFKSRYFYITYSNQDHSFGLTKFDTNGVLLWKKNISGYYYEPMCITHDTSGNIYLTGDISYNGINSFTVKYNPQGDTLWSAIYYPSTNGGAFSPHSISVDNSKNVYITGNLNNPDFTFAYGTIKYDSSGNRKWISKYYSPMSPNHGAGGGCVKADNKGNCYVTGGATYANINGIGYTTPVTIKYGPNGDSIWTRLFRLQDTIQFGGAYDMFLDENDNLFIPCNYTIKYDKDGNLKWYANNSQYMWKAVILEKNIYVSGGYGGQEISRIIGYNQYNGSVIFNQQYTTFTGPTSFMTFGRALYSAISANDSAILIKYSSNVNHINSGELNIKKFTLYQNYPNPFNPVTKINYALPTQGFVSLKIYDITGREIKTLVNEVKQAGYYTVDFNGSNYSSGVYFYRIQSGDFVQTKRMVLLK